jgi:replicative superfamily II helicase
MSLERAAIRHLREKKFQAGNINVIALTGSLVSAQRAVNVPMRRFCAASHEAA